MHFRVSAVLPIDAETFFVERDSAAFRSLVAKSMHLGALDIVDGWTEGEAEVYKFVTRPDLDKFVPKGLQKYFAKHGLQYTDIITYDPKLINRPPFRLPVRSIPPILPDRSRIECTLIIEEEEPGQTCRQTLEGLVEFRLAGLGRLAERIVVDSLHKVYSGISTIVERWVVIRDEVLTQEGGREMLFLGRPDNSGVEWISDNIRAVLQAPYKCDAKGKMCAHQDADPSVPEQPAAADVRRDASEADPSQPEGKAERTLVELDGDLFLDTLEDLENPAWEDDFAAETALWADDEAATQWFEREKLAGHQPPHIDLTASTADIAEPPSTEEKQELPKVAGKRFSARFNKNQAAWEEFWEHHEVPALPDIPSLAARLANLLRLAAVRVPLIRKPLRHRSRTFHYWKRHCNTKHDRAWDMVRLGGPSRGHLEHDKRDPVPGYPTGRGMDTQLKDRRLRTRARERTGKLGRAIQSRVLP